MSGVSLPSCLLFRMIDPWRTMKRLEQKRALPSPGKPVLLILSPSPLQVSVIQCSYITIFQENFDYYLQVVAK